MGIFSSKKKQNTEIPEPNQFECNGKKYNVLRGGIIPMANGAQKLSAADICVSKEAQEHLVVAGSSIIEEVV